LGLTAFSNTTFDSRSPLDQIIGGALPIANIKALGAVRQPKQPYDFQAGDMTLEALRGVGDVPLSGVVRIRP
jgi:hypothetical protein